MRIVHCGKLEIVHKSNGVDGFPTTLLVNGNQLPDYYPPVWEVAITLETMVDELLRVYVETSTDDIITYIPKQFDFTFGELRVVIRSDRNPCATFINGVEVKVKYLRITFREGEVPWVNIVYLPTMEKV